MNFIMKKNGSAVNFTEHGDVDFDFFKWTIDDVCSYYENHGVMTVHFWSGAGAFGKRVRNADISRAYSTIEQRAFCSIGQSRLFSLIQDEFKKRGYDAAQLLVTDEDLTIKKKDIEEFINYCISNEIFVIGNYNDPTSGKEVLLDNDEPAGDYAIAFKADKLVITGIAEGFWDCNKRILSNVSQITEEHYSFCEGKNGYGTGGPIPKLKIAEKCIANNLPMYMVGKYVSLEELDRKGTYFGI